MLSLYLQLAFALGKAFAQRSISAEVLLDILSLGRLAPFHRWTFFTQLLHLFVRAIWVAEQLTTPATVYKMMQFHLNIIEASVVEIMHWGC